MRLAVILLALFPPAFAPAQEQGGLREQFQKPPEGVTYDPGYVEEVIEVERPVSRSIPQPVAMIRGLDKISGRVTDIRAEVGAPVAYERLTILVEDCRQPPPDEPPDAFVFMKVQDSKFDGREVFSGWMFASSPALSAMDHQRYDLWVLSCSAS